MVQSVHFHRRWVLGLMPSVVCPSFGQVPLIIPLHNSKISVTGSSLFSPRIWRLPAANPGIFGNIVSATGSFLRKIWLRSTKQSIRSGEIRQVALIGVEPPSVADVNDREELVSIHRILLEGGVTIVEGLTNLDELTQKQVTFIALPLKIDGGDGSPVRAIAIEGDLADLATAD